MASGPSDHKGIRNVLLQSFGPIPLYGLLCGAVVGRVTHSLETILEVTPSGFISHGTSRVIILLLRLVYSTESTCIIFSLINF